MATNNTVNRPRKNKRWTAAEAQRFVKKANSQSRAILSQLGSVGEEKLAANLNIFNINYVREYRFHPSKRYRADFYLPDYNVLVEVEGGTRGVSRHTTYEGYSKDLMKYNDAQILGFARLAFTTEQVNKGLAIEKIKQYIAAYEQRQAETKEGVFHA
ncbi:hypothetical protein OIV75_003392 [Acinetobacter baumannii]|nr:hypothetical protein [Acinetobacter baumannii]EKV8352286.1 hypothetical protein [Acinetobacter baumannii]EKV9553386.1 hypothetical protein [Acinetobacter baumannii]EKW6573513.1 hypothetical protein [Acinetobacter baumannii]EKW6582975.1 hypothetical protein [Acinetobacter baumannii]